MSMTINWDRRASALHRAAYWWLARSVILTKEGVGEVYGGGAGGNNGEWKVVDIGAMGEYVLCSNGLIVLTTTKEWRVLYSWGRLCDAGLCGFSLCAFGVVIVHNS